MPGYRTHIGGAGCVYAVLLTFLYKILLFKVGPFRALEWFLSCVLGALFPDIDIKSKGQGIFYRVVLVLLCVLLYKNKFAEFILVSLLSFIPLLVHHRGLFHRPWFVIALPFFCALIISWYKPGTDIIILIDALFFSFGALSHIYLDRLQTCFKLS